MSTFAASKDPWSFVERSSVPVSLLSDVAVEPDLGDLEHDPGPAARVPALAGGRGAPVMRFTGDASVRASRNGSIGSFGDEYFDTSSYNFFFCLRIILFEIS